MPLGCRGRHESWFGTCQKAAAARPRRVQCESGALVKAEGSDRVKQRKAQAVARVEKNIDFTQYENLGIPKMNRKTAVILAGLENGRNSKGWTDQEAKLWTTKDPTFVDNNFMNKNTSGYKVVWKVCVVC